jgi:hypothetical protein
MRKVMFKIGADGIVAFPDARLLDYNVRTNPVPGRYYAVLGRVS